MKAVKRMLSAAMVLAGVAGVGSLSSADDLKDGISEATEEPITADESVANKSVNLKFIIADAIGQAKKASKVDGKIKTNYNDGEGENNQNSIIVEPGSRVDKVINVINEK